MSRIPKSLHAAPLVEAIFELRFDPSQPSAGELLPGLLYRDLSSLYPNAEQLPLGGLPFAVRDTEALRYQPIHRLTGETGLVQVGHRVTSLSSGTTYPGWPEFKIRIENLLAAVQRTTLAKRIERFSFRYLNIVPVPLTPKTQLSILNADIKLLGQAVSERGFQLRTEMQGGRFVTIVQLRTNAVAKRADGSEREGLMVDLDTIHDVQDASFWSNASVLLEDAHAEVKRTFFSLLTTAAIDSLLPIWEDS